MTHKLEHKHLLVTANLMYPIKNTEYIETWIKELIKKIDMEILMGPYSIYYDVPGNTGITAFCIITTSHIGLHTFENDDGVQLELDLYSCKSFDPHDVFDHLKLLNPIDINHKFLNRETGFSEIQLNRK